MTIRTISHVCSRAWITRIPTTKTWITRRNLTWTTNRTYITWTCTYSTYNFFKIFTI
ncbi:hypothetical protein ACNFU2_12905 [Chryseobacterium sp. PTM-20240506]|uniref:hypothetical protein n=1 Tax=unclassified Chryseobacterium TaxID=2593645 RepID=UPI0023584DF0|nr:MULTISPECIES: hypothetical protein [unclassified Chryseobacterium]MDC8105791.1 hypothetical protein [Chryseobacterium sp. B21-037]MDQ1804294.1 hypothetical protein [Chryseobacterium sp. CKR4-1]